MNFHRYFSRFFLATLCCGLLTSCKTELYTQLDEREVVEMIGLLQSKGIDASKKPSKESKWKLVVNEKEVSPAIQILQNSGYPKNQHTSIGDTFKGDGIVPSKFAERARYLHATTEELSSTLERIDGVYSARVHLVSNPNEERSENQAPSVSSASVFLKCRPELADETSGISLPVEEVKKLIAHGVPGLSIDKVSVSVFPTTPLENHDIILQPQTSSIFSNRILLFITAIVFIGVLYLMRDWHNKRQSRLSEGEIQ